jgi:hypothetical protein
MESTLQSFQHTMKMLVFNQLKTNDPFIDAILTTLVFIVECRIYIFLLDLEYYTCYKLLYRKLKKTNVVLNTNNIIHIVII